MNYRIAGWIIAALWTASVPLEAAALASSSERGRQVESFSFARDYACRSRNDYHGGFGGYGHGAWWAPRRRGGRSTWHRGYQHRHPPRRHYNGRQGNGHDEQGNSRWYD